MFTKTVRIPFFVPKSHLLVIYFNSERQRLILAYFFINEILSCWKGMVYKRKYVIII